MKYFWMVNLINILSAELLSTVHYNSFNELWRIFTEDTGSNPLSNHTVKSASKSFQIFFVTQIWSYRPTFSLKKCQYEFPLCLSKIFLLF